MSPFLGAIRLAALDRRGIEAIDPTPFGAWRSCVLFVHMVLIHVAIDMLDMPPGVDVLPFLLLSALGFLVQMAGYLVMTAQVLDGMGRADRFPLFVSTYNWCSAVTSLVNLTGALLAAQASIPIANGIAIGLFFWGLYYSWFTVRLALSCPGPVAAGLVLLEVLIALLTQGLAGQMAALATAG